jgi:nucleoside triphosphate pyrophosphatase
VDDPDVATDCARFVLASGSPRRAEILERLGIDFEILAADIDETPLRDERPLELVVRVSAAKADVVSAQRPGQIVVAADTVVVVDGEPLGKPHHPDAAAAMLDRLLGRSHTVLTGVVVRGADGTEHAVVESATVTMRQVGPDVRDWYVATGEALDKAGAYALQGVGALLVDSVGGDPTTIIGLPFGPTVDLLRRAGLRFP